LRKCNVSQCHCSGVLCQSCLIRELKLTHGRANGLLQCTVCKDEYDVETEFNFKLKRDCKSLCIDSLIHCGLKDEQYLLDSIGGKIGFFLVILGINTWILSTSLLFAFPPNGCPIELYYMVSIFDFAVGVSTIWFIIKCRYLSPLFLSIMYFVRFLYILLGWIPSINLCNIYIYHDYQSNHVSILSYFLSFSFIAFIVMGICWIIDLNHQYKKYEKENGKLVINTNHSKIEINDIATQENDQYWLVSTQIVKCLKQVRSDMLQNIIFFFWTLFFSRSLVGFLFYFVMFICVLFVFLFILSFTFFFISCRLFKDFNFRSTVFHIYIYYKFERQFYL